MDTCRLCRRPAVLRESHIVPRFVSNWIKETALSPFLRESSQPRKRVQDTRKLALLCDSCEERFAVWERRFRQDVFVPLQESLRAEGFELRFRDWSYDEWLLSFIVSVAWRILVIHSLLPVQRPELAAALQRTEEAWRLFLLGDSRDPGRSAHHLLFLRSTPSAEGLEPTELLALNWYIRRAIDALLVVNPVAAEVHAYAKFPGIVIWSGIEPAEPKSWNNTRVLLRGTLAFPRTVADPRFREFFFRRAHALGPPVQMSARQEQRLRQALLKDPERLQKSPSVDLYLAQGLVWERRDPDESQG